MSTQRSGFCRSGIFLYLVLIVLSAWSTQCAPVYESESTQIAEYDASSSGCYYNFQRYQEGSRIITNEPCLNCTCYNRMLMCYLRVCPFTKAIGQDCTIEKRPDQCCPVITCPEVPVQLLTSTASPSSKSSTSLLSNYDHGDNSSSGEVGFPDTYGCNINNEFFADGAQLPTEANNPCELCYCIRNKTTCLMQQCTLSVAGCRPVYQHGTCCPIKYNCEYDEKYEITAGTTPSLIMTTTLAPRTTPPQCRYDDKFYEDGELIYTIQPCQHCYCFHGEIVCAIQECGKPMEAHGKNCTALPPLEGECCPTTYQCNDGFENIGTEIPEEGSTKNMAQEAINQENNKQQESFPGADNTIPQQIISEHVHTTNKSALLGNDVSESMNHESPEQSSNETEIEKQSIPISEYEKDKVSIKNRNQQTDEMVTESDISNLILSLNKSNDSTESLADTTDHTVTIPKDISSKSPLNIKENNQESNKLEFEELYTESKISHVDNQFTTPLTQEIGIETSTDIEFTNAFTTGKEIKELEKLTTKSSINENEYTRSSQFDLITSVTELSEETTSTPNETKEKSIDSSSSINKKTMSEQSIDKKITEPMFYITDSEPKNPIYDMDRIHFTTERSPNTIEYASDKTEDRINEDAFISTNYETYLTTSFDENTKTQNNSTQFIYENPTTNIYSDDKQFEKTKNTEENINIKNTKTTTAVNLNEPKETEKVISSVNLEGTPLSSSLDDKNIDLSNESASTNFITTTNSNEIKILEGIDIRKNIESSTSISTLDENNSKTEIISSISFESSTTDSFLINKESTENNFPIKNISNDNRNQEVMHESTNFDYLTTEKNLLPTSNSIGSNTILEESNNDEKLVHFNTKIQSQENTEAVTIEENPVKILLPERVPEHKAEDNDAVTDAEAMNEYNASISEILHSLNNLKPDQLEYELTTYLPPYNLNTKPNIKPSISVHEAFPKENSETEKYATEILITSKSPSDQTTVNYNGEVFENMKSEEKEKPNVYTSVKEGSIEETNTKQITSNILPEQEYAMKDIGISLPQTSKETDVTQKILLEEGTTKSTVIISESILENDNSKDHSEMSTIVPESTHTLEITPSVFRNEQESIDESTVNDSLIYNEEINYENTEHANIELNNNTELNVMKTKFEEENPIMVQQTFEETNKNIEQTTEISHELSIDKITQFPLKDDKFIQKTTDEENQFKPSTEIITMTEYKSSDPSIQSQFITETTPLIDSTADLKQETVPYSIENGISSSEKPLSSENMFNHENKVEYSTENNLSSSQITEMELKIPMIPEIRPAPGIPGEGNCLVDGQSYSNNSSIPPANACQLNCRCISSIVQCELVKCSPPPINLLNCRSIYTQADLCCPMYTCDSSSSVELETGNQMSDYHTPSFQEKIQTEVTLNSFDEQPNYTSKTDLESKEQTSKSAIKSQSEILESVSVNSEQDKLLPSSISLLEKETSSPSIILETTPTILEQSIVSEKNNEEKLSVSLEEINKYNEQNKPNMPFHNNDNKETTVTIDEFSNIKFEGTTEKIIDEIPLELESQTENNKIDELITKKNDISESESEDKDFAIFTKEHSNASDEAQISTQTSILLESDIKDIAQTELLHTTEKLKDINENIKPVLISFDSNESIEKEIQKETSSFDELTTSSVELTSFKDVDNLSSAIIPEQDTNQNTEFEHSFKHGENSLVEIGETSTDVNTDLFITTILPNDNTFESQKHEIEYFTTVAPKKQLTLTSTSLEATQEDETILYTGIDTATDKRTEMSDLTSNDFSSTSYPISVEESGTTEVFIDESKENQSIVTTENNMEHEVLSETSDKILLVKDSSEQSLPEVTLSSLNENITTPILETTQLTVENISNEESNKLELDNKIESGEKEETIFENSTEKSENQEDEVIVNFKETTEIFEIKNQEEITSSSITEENQVDFKPTELSLNLEKETEKAIEGENEIHLIDQSNLTEIPKTEIMETVTNVKSILYESSTSNTNDLVTEDEKLNDSIKITENLTNKPDDENELKTVIKDDTVYLHETSTKIESTNVDEIYNNNKSSNDPTHNPNKEVEYEFTTKSIYQDKQKDPFTEATLSEISSSHLIPSLEPNKTESDTLTVSSEEIVTPINILTPEFQTTLYDLHEQSIKGSQDELTNSEIADVTNSEDEQYHTHIQQTDEPTLSVSHKNDQQHPTESHTTALNTEIGRPHTRPEYPDQQKPETDDESVFPPDTADIKNSFNTDDSELEDYDDQAVYGPGTCRYGGKIYMSAQQIPRDDACDFCFCFRSDIICLQQSCPPPIPGCHEEPIGGFCCPRYECPVSMAMSLNMTTTTTTTTTTLPPHFLTHAHKGGAFRGGCQIGNRAYRVGEDIKSKSGPCMSCICGGDGKMKCEPKACSASPMLKEMIAHAAAKKRRR